MYHVKKARALVEIYLSPYIGMDEIDPIDFQKDLRKCLTDLKRLGILVYDSKFKSMIFDGVVFTQEGLIMCWKEV